jgi:phenylacetate-CoA ligase
MLDPPVERRPRPEQLELDDAAFREQTAYLLEHSPFYRRKLSGLDVEGGLAEIAQLPFTEKQELKESQTDESPFGAHFCASPSELVRIYSTSGTTGAPSYIPLTAADLENWVTASARSYAASGLASGDRVVTTYNAGPFVAGAALDAFERIGVCHVPVGTGSTERLLLAIERLRPDAVVLTPSYAAYLLERAVERGVDLPGASVRRVIVAGEPGGGEPEFRARLEQGWGARVTEAMGVGDIGPSLFGECEEQKGMHLGARGFVHLEVIDPESGSGLELADGVEGELVLTHLRHRAAPLLRFRTRDHVEVWTGACPCGRTSPRIRCLGRTDDMVIVRGVNVFPSAIRDVVSAFAPAVSGQVLVRPLEPGVKQEPPLPVAVELGQDSPIDTALAEAIRERIHAALVVQTQVELVPWGSLQRSEYKSKLLERPQ